MSAERPVTLGIDIGVIKMIITHAAAVHRLDISPEPADRTRVAVLADTMLDSHSKSLG